MADISPQLAKIMSATYGETVRSAIYDALVAMNNELASLSQAVTDAVKKADTYSKSLGTSDDTANKNGASVWAQLKYLKRILGDPNDAELLDPTAWSEITEIRRFLGTPYVDASETSTMAWARINWLTETLQNESEEDEDNKDGNTN